MRQIVSILTAFFFFAWPFHAQNVVVNGTTLVNSGGGVNTCVANGFKLVGTAQTQGACASLTQNTFDAGGMWICDPINLNQSFKLYFEANFDAFNSGDGMAFVLQTEGVPNVLGGEGGGIGYSYGNLGGCLPTGNCNIDPSVIVEFDIWDNSADLWNTALPALGNINDISCDHATILVDGNQSASGSLAGPSCLLPPNGMVTDGQLHDVCIIWDVPNLQYSVYFDSVLVTTYNGDIRTNFANPASVNWGFTAGSGGANQNQRVCNVDMNTNVTNPSCTCIVPIASYSPVPVEICSGGTTAVALTSNVPNTTFDWISTLNPSVTGASTSLQTGNSIQETLTNISTLPQIVNYTVTPSVVGCSNGPTITVPVTIYPTPTITGQFTICAGATSQLVGSGAPNFNNPWVSSNAGVATIDNSGMISGVSAGTTTITYTDINGCQTSNNISVDPQDLASFSTTDFCFGAASPPANTSGTVVGSFSFNPNPADGATVDPVTGSINGGIGGTTYTLQFTTNGNCPATPTQNVTVFALPNVSAGADLVVCEGDQAVLTGSGATNYAWSPNGIIDGQAFIPVATATYTVTGTDGNGCSNTDNVLITVEPLPMVSFSVDDTAGCSPLAVTFTNTSVGNFSNCVWSTSNGFSQLGCGTVNGNLINPGWYDITLSVTSANGCSNSLTQLNQIYVEDVQASFTLSQYELTESNSTVDFTNNSIGAVSYSWDFDDNGATSIDVNPTHTFSATNSEFVIELIALSPLGCEDRAWQTISVDEEPIFYVPNAFTPNGDEHNGSFNPIFTSGFDPYDFQMSIYDRWGELIWQSNDAAQGWDGSYLKGDNRIVPDGIYVWSIEFKNPKVDDRIQLTGHVSVLR